MNLTIAIPALVALVTGLLTPIYLDHRKQKKLDSSTQVSSWDKLNNRLDGENVELRTRLEKMEQEIDGLRTRLAAATTRISEQDDTIRHQQAEIDTLRVQVGQP